LDTRKAGVPKVLRQELINVHVYSAAKEKKTNPLITKYEYSNIKALRMTQLSNGAVPFIDDTDFEDIGSSLGLNPLKRFFYINLPLAWKSIINGAALGWARAISEFGATLVFAGNLTGETQTMPLAIISTMESDFELGITLSAILILISTLVLILLARLRHYT